MNHIKAFYDKKNIEYHEKIQQFFVNQRKKTKKEVIKKKQH